MIDVPVAAGDVFVSASAVVLILAPAFGASLDAEYLTRRALLLRCLAILVVSMCALAFSWRGIPDGPTTAVLAHVALAVITAAFVQFGYGVRRLLPSDLTAAFAAVACVASVTVGPFAVGPLLGDLSLSASRWLLSANPLVTIATAAGIDLLHVDMIYRTSPLAHRGVALPAWPATCIGYVLFGSICYLSSRSRLRSTSSV